ncbi:hypothetical protein Dred_1631 [Desulforamulus reducens MI-1]|uniref:Uncharacterized protein n=1 Tax=Desulforamulus reducens (strain ATCC BAA-1160 / DSM 100696 / MI-1) TaxID=349161 RepID=A4J506_DESRM|nr:hypothetical protein [Desulforamulus reducens]ABO50159.1 hypothetical protein Dred_1631 [Desulforamulus reducens MI-1]
MDILISAVGVRDPYAKDGSKGAVLTLVDKLKPDICFLFGTDPGVNEEVENTHQRALQIKQIVKESVKIISIPMVLPDPTDHREILLCFEQHLNEIITKYHTTKPHYHVNVSSGTSQMHAALMLLFNGRRLKAKIYQVKEPRFVNCEAERVAEVDASFIEEENYIFRAKKFFLNFNFSAAQDELIELALFTTREKRQKRAELFSDICRAYKYWDRYEHEQARDILEKLIVDIQRFKINELADITIRQINILKSICANKPRETVATIKDLLHNANRKKIIGEYGDCLNRYKRLIDGLAACKCGLTGSKRVNDQPVWVQDILIHKKKNDNLYYSDYLTIYREKNNKEMIPQSLNDKMLSLNRRRNTSYVAHGMDSVSKQDAEESINILWKMATSLFSGEKWKEYEFSADVILNISELLFNDL